MNKSITKDIIQWDVENWSKALRFWQAKTNVDKGGLVCLELGGNAGGLSLWLALNQNKVVCSDLETPGENAKKLHEKYPSAMPFISYEGINATAINYENHFDVVALKSIIGGISRGGKQELKQQIIDQIHQSLKPNGQVLFAENMESSLLHRWMRKRFTNWGEQWNYLRLDEVAHLFGKYSRVEFATCGFFGAFGRTEAQRNALGKLDRIVDYFVPNSKNYIVYGVAQK